MAEKKTYLTPEGLKKLKKELETLVNVRRGEVATRIQKALEEGDPNDNPEYDAARDEQLRLERQIAELEEVIKNAELIKEDKESDVVTLGSTVVVECEGEKDEFTIVGSVEADPSLGKISNESPVGQALLGARVGDVIKVSSTIKTTYKILEIK